jgi:HSP20 family protein
MLYNTFDAILNSISVDPYYKYNYATKPKANIYKKENEYQIEMAVPGFSREDIEITVEDNAVIVSADLKFEKDKKNLAVYREFDYSKFERSWTLPDGVDTNGVNAIYEAGILKVSVPIKNTKTTKKIKIE